MTRLFYFCSWLLPLQIIIVPVFALEKQEVHDVVIMSTRNARGWQFTCFDPAGSSLNNLTAEILSCCTGIDQALQSINEKNERQRELSPLEVIDCSSQIAQVPSLGSLSDISMAQYSLSLSLPIEENQNRQVGEQYVWNSKENSHEHHHQSPIAFPFTRDIVQNLEYTDTISISATLEESGGMHRNWHQKVIINHEYVGNVKSVYIFWTIPQGMFVDLDDAVGFLHAVDIEYTLHSALVCDIEQPAFVSGQHILILEITTFDDNRALPSSPLEFFAKLHLRYPSPSPKNEQWIQLPSPQMIWKDAEGKLFANSFDTIGNEPIWVAAGNQDDYDFVMWTTILACWVGVVWMLQDISHVSSWDRT